MRSMSDNQFQLGVFGQNVWGGLTKTLAPERWDASWQNGLEVAQMADDGGIEFLLPLGQWRGLGQAEHDGSSYETLTWASGLLAATKRITIFATLHTPLMHPLFAAKLTVTADHIGSGRVGLNVVSGSNAPEFAMFGVELLEHDERYVYTEEWVSILKRAWSEPEPFDHDGKYFQLTGVMSDPKPYGGDRPLLISAGSSPAGSAFATSQADTLFMFIGAPDKLPEQIRLIREAANNPGFPILGAGHLFCRPTTRETDEYYEYIVREQGDWQAAEVMKDAVFGKQQRSMPAAMVEQMTERMVSGGGTFGVKGDPDAVASKLAQLHEAGLNGMAFALPNYLDDLPVLIDEVIPRLERLGLRGAKLPV